VKKRELTIRLLRAAEEDLSEIYEYIASENRKAAEAILTRIEKDLAHLARQPQLGRVPSDEELVCMGYRYLIVTDYLVFYTLEEQTVLIHRIIHGARDYLRLM
jgi:toxin ParE1/3/4